MMMSCYNNIAEFLFVQFIQCYVVAAKKFLSVLLVKHRKEATCLPPLLKKFSAPHLFFFPCTVLAQTAASTEMTMSVYDSPVLVCVSALGVWIRTGFCRLTSPGIYSLCLFLV